MDNNQPKPRRRRARKPDGQFQGDNPNTPANEAWEPVALEESIVAAKENKYKVRPQVTGTSGDSAGKYGKKPKIRPGMGGVTTTYH